VEGLADQSCSWKKGSEPDRKVPSIQYSWGLMTGSMGHCTPITEGSPGARRRKRKLSQFRSWTVHAKNTKGTEGRMGSRLILTSFFLLPSEPKQAHVKNLDQTMTHLYKNCQIDDDANNSVVSKETDKRNRVRSLHVNGAPAPVFAVIESNSLRTRKTQTVSTSFRGACAPRTRVSYRAEQLSGQRHCLSYV
jgi:hypothetical protein